MSKKRNKDKLQQEAYALFQTEKWLKTIALDQYGFLSLGGASGIIAEWPYLKKQKYGFTIITMPPLTPYLGPHITYPEGQKYTNRLSHEKKVLTQLIEQLPAFDYFIQYFPPSFTNWLPLHWKGFQQTTRYTYILPDLSDLDKVWKGFRENIRREVRKASKTVTVETGIDLEDFYNLHLYSFREKGERMPFSYPYLKNIDRFCEKEKCRKTFYAVDRQQNVHAALYLVWDAHTAYYLLGATHPHYKKSGAMSLVMWQAIQFAAEQVNRFDFEGSMIEPVERYFRAFGAQQTPYFEIKKINHPLLKLKESLGW